MVKLVVERKEVVAHLDAVRGGAGKTDAVTIIATDENGKKLSCGNIVSIYVHEGELVLYRHIAVNCPGIPDGTIRIVGSLVE